MVGYILLVVEIVFNSFHPGPIFRLELLAALLNIKVMIHCTLQLEHGFFCRVHERVNILHFFLDFYIAIEVPSKLLDEVIDSYFVIVLGIGALLSHLHVFLARLLFEEVVFKGHLGEAF